VLVDRLGPDKQITVRGSAIAVSLARSLVPAYYFPMTSAADLASKLADLEISLGDDDLEVLAQRAAVPGDAAGGWS
jgi:hypothetical protein